MYPIQTAALLAPDVKRFEIEAPRVARKGRPGQFVIVRVHERGERIPLTIASSDPGRGLITLIVQGIGKTTRLMNALGAGDALRDVVGPLGHPSDIQHYSTVVVIGGGVGTAIAYPTARALKRSSPGRAATSRRCAASAWSWASRTPRRRAPVAVAGSEFDLPVRMAIVALGTGANPLVQATTPDLRTDRRGYIAADAASLRTSERGVFAAGDIVTGAATVILAMAAGRTAARSIAAYLDTGEWTPAPAC